MLEIIYHTASIKKDTKTFLELLKTDVETIELDFVLTKDFVPIWTHKKRINFKCIGNIESKNKLLKNYLTLKDIIKLNNSKKKLLLDFKYINKKILNEKNIKKILSDINQNDNIMIQSINIDFIKYLMIINDYKNIKKGLIINYFTSYFINEKNIVGIKNIDFISLASELWEVKGGSFLKKSEKLFPKAKKYAWTWDAIYKEHMVRLENYKNKKADGIITSTPEKVKNII